MINSYGLTEATVDSAFFEGPVDGLEPGLMVPIGRPLPNSTLHVLDAYGEPVPPGVPGELWIGGAGVALGYAGDPEQTGAPLRDPYPRAGGRGPRRSGCTGPVTWRAGTRSGRVHLLGRGDNQVKLRGHRIEIGRDRGASGGVAGARPGSGGGPPGRGRGGDVVRLLRGGARCDAGPACAAPPPRGRAAHLHGPSHVAELAELPLTAHGKVDVGALPPPRAATTGSRRTKPR